MKKISILIICFCIALSATAQVRFSAGLGANTGIFLPTTPIEFNYIPKVMPNFNLQMAIKKGEESMFSGFVQMNFSPKRIGTKNTGEINGVAFEEGSTHYISSGELLLGGAIDFKLKNIIIRPQAGIFFAFNQKNGFLAYANGSKSLTLANFNYQADEPFFFIYPGVNYGFSVVKRMFNDSREAAFFVEVYYAPRNIFPEPFAYSYNNQDYVIQGKYHSLNMGIRMDLNKS
jgi:hypothetical protein